MFQKISKNKGFTLIELLVVISIIGMLSSVVLVSLNSARDKGKFAAAQKFAGHTYRAFGSSAGGIWDFNEPSGNTLLDSSGNGNSGTLSSKISGSVPQRVTGSSNTFNGNGGALDFNTPGVNRSGSGEYVLIPYNSNNSTLFTATKGTMSAWIKTSVTNREMYIIFKQSSDALGIAAGGTLMTYQSISPTNRNTSANVADNKWHHVAMSFDSVASKLSMYVDGKNVPITNGTTFGRVLNNSNYAIGNNVGWNGQDFTGTIDDVAIYSEVLAASEIERLYAQGLPSHTLADAN